MGAPLVVPLDESTELDTVGGKAASLARLRRAGLPVPPGFTVTTAAYRAFVTGHGLDEQIRHGASAEVAALITTHEVPAEVAGAVREAYAALGAPAVVVRSSATAEDLPGLSFAGQQDSVLDVRGAAAVPAAVRRCWASLWTERAVAYRAQHGVDPNRVAMAVVVQELVDADAAGVLFTADPVTGAGDRMVVEATWGLGESLVGGSVTPDHLVLDAATGAVRQRRTGDKAVVTVRTATGVAQRPVPEKRRHAPVLDDGEVAELAGLGRRIAALYGCPMDVEWARAGRRFAIVQARPVTGLRDPWNDSLAADHLWTSTNLGEAIPDVMTPCTWSLVQIFMRRAMATASLPGWRGYGRVGGRFYLDLSVTAAISRAVGIGERRFRALTERTFGRLPDGVVIPPVPLPRRRVLRQVLPIAVRVLRAARRDRPRLPAYVAANPDRCAALVARIAATTDSAALAGLWDGELRPLLEVASDMLSAAGRADPVALLTVERRLRRLAGPADAAALMTGLTVDGDVLESLGPLVGLARLERGEIDRDAWARRYGHRSPHEFEVALPRPSEDPEWFDRQLAGQRAAGTDPLALLERQEAAHRAAWERLVAAHPRAVRRVRARLRRWARAERGREQARSEVVRVFAVARAYALRAGELARLGDEVFMLDVDEIAAALRGAPVPDTTQRRAAYERYRVLPPYPALIRGRFDPFAWAADPHRRTDLYDPSTAAGATPDGAVTGFPGAAGVVEGPARVLAHADDGAALRPGEVLVTTVTNVGWTPLFPRAAAIVTDVGAPLSHAAIVARELGIPAVVGCGNATARLHTGDRVRVDGGRGTIEVLAPTPAAGDDETARRLHDLDVANDWHREAP